MKIIDKYIEIVGIDGAIKTIHGYINHYISRGWLNVKFETESGGHGTYSKAMSHIESYDLHVATIKNQPIEHINVDVVIKKDDKMKQEKFDELVEWFKGRFKDIKTITRVVRADKVIKDTHGEPTGVVREGGIFTTVVLTDGRAGVVTVQKISEDNPELGVLWAYTKAKEKKVKSTFPGGMTMGHDVGDFSYDSNVVLSGSRQGASNCDSYIKFIHNIITTSRY